MNLAPGPSCRLAQEMEFLIQIQMDRPQIRFSCPETIAVERSPCLPIGMGGVDCHTRIPYYLLHIPTQQRVTDLPAHPLLRMMSTESSLDKGRDQ